MPASPAGKGASHGVRIEGGAHGRHPSPPTRGRRTARSQRFHTRWPGSIRATSFSFGHHYDPENTHHGLLLVINDDVVAPGTGFGTHPHRDMEIVTWVLDGELEHKDSEGNPG